MEIGQIYQSFVQPGARETGTVARGSFGGHQITVSDPVSLAANSAEEVGFAMSEREKSRLDERKMKPRGPDLHRLEQIEKYTQLMDRQGRKQDLEAFVSSLAGKKDLTPGQAMKEALKFFKDTGDAYTALAFAGNALAGKFAPGLFAEAMDQLEDMAGQNIRTRLSAGAAVLDFSASDFSGPDFFSSGEADGLKDLYSATVSDLGAPGDIYEQIIQRYGEERFEDSMAFLIRSLGNDMAATTSSTDKVRLAGLSRDLGTVQQLHGLHAQCKTLAARIEKTSSGQSPMTGTSLVKAVLKLRDAKFIGAFDIEAMADEAKMKSIEDRIGFFQDFSNMARNLSENLFWDNNGRLSLIQAAQDALDDAIAVENQMYEDQH